MRMFIVGHSIDNYEDGIDLMNVVFYRAGWTPPADDRSDGEWEVRVHFTSGYWCTVGLTERGYKEFKRDLIKVKIVKEK